MTLFLHYFWAISYGNNRIHNAFPLERGREYLEVLHQ